MSNNLTFVRTLTVEQFKAEQHVSEVRVRRNPQTGLLFMTYGASVGAVSSKGIPTKPMISEVIGDNEVKFWLMHEEGTGGAPILATF